MRNTRVLGASLLLACGGGSGQQGAPPNGEAAVDVAMSNPARTDVVPQKVAGGQTGEFSGGDIGSCPEVESSEPLALDDAELAPWVAIAAGHHEQTLRWRRVFLSDAIRGFEEHTTVSIDVSVLGARERVYGDGGFEGYEFESCRDRRSRQLELDVRLETADGAVVASFREWYEPLDIEGVATLERIRLDPDAVITDIDFSGSLEMGLDPAAQAPPRLWAQVSFTAESVSGGIAPFIPPPEDGGLGAPSSWTPVSAEFPDDECGGGEVPMGLDDSITSLRDTPRLAFERAAAAYAAESPIPAVWEAPSYRQRPVDVEIPPPTQVNVSLGEPTHACLSSDIAVVYAPLTVVSVDGRVNVTQSVGVALYGDASVGGGIETPWVPASDFAQQFGLSGVALDEGAFGKIALGTNLNLEGDGVEGYLTAHQWNAFREDLAAGPRFRWCRGTICTPIPEP